MLYYELYRDAGDDYTSSFTLVKEILASDTLTYTAVNGVDAVLGKTYRYKVWANNTKGFSEFSDEAFIAFGDKPPWPPKISKADSFSTRSSIKVKFAEVVADLPVTGYIINMDDGKNG